MDQFRMPLIGEKAPEFQAETSMGPVRFPADYKGRWVVFFSHPGDFTPVCTTEMMAMARMKDRFTARNAALLGLSTDSNPSHIAWIRAIGGTEWNGVARPRIDFPIVADHQGEIARRYGMLMPSVSGTQAVRSVFVVDPKGMVRAIQFYPMTTGRSVEEIYRLMAALQTTDSTGNPTPADWQPGQQTLLPNPATLPQAERVGSGAPAAGDNLGWCLRQAPAGVNAPMANAPTGNAPMDNAPMANAPMANAPMANAPMANTPIANAPVANAPMAKAPTASHPSMPSANGGGAPRMPAPARPQSAAKPGVPLMPDIADLIRIVNAGSPMPMQPASNAAPMPAPNRQTAGMAVPHPASAGGITANTAPVAAGPAPNAANMPGKPEPAAKAEPANGETCDNPVAGRPFKPEPAPDDPQSILEQNRMLLNWNLAHTGKSGVSAKTADPFAEWMHK